MRLSKPGSRRSILAGAVLLAATAGSGFASTTSSVQFALNFSGSASTASGFQPGPAAGTISPFGQATAALMFSGSGTVTVRGTFTLSSGDFFSGTFTGPAPGVFHIHDNVVFTFSGDITSGTGIFESTTGTLQGTVTIFDINPGAPSNYTFTGSGTVVVQVTGSGGLSALPLSLAFRLAEGGSASATQGVTLRNQGFSTVPFQAVGSVSSGSNWLSVAPASGTVPPGSTLLLNVTASVAGARAGVYNGQVDVTFPGGSLTLSVQLLVAAGPNLQLSQQGITIQAIAGASPPPVHTIVASNTGTGSLAGLTATATVLKTDQKWLSATIVPTQDGQRYQVNISVDQTGLLPNKYYGRVDVSANGAANSPQSVIVVLYLNPDDYDGGASFGLEAMGFQYQPPGPPTGPLHFVITNNSKKPLTFSAQINYVNAPGFSPWLSASPSSGVVNPGKSVTVLLSVSPIAPLPQVPGAPPAGTMYFARIQISFAEIKQTLGTLLGYAVDPNTSTLGAPQPRQQTSMCTTTQLAALFTPVVDGFQNSVAAPVPLEVQVFDACGRSVDTGSMVVTFSAGDPPLPLAPIGGGRWAATWVPRKAGAQTITVNAQTDTASGTTTLDTSVTANTDTPVIGGVGSAASGATTIAPGEFIAIYGSSLASATTVTQSVPFPPSLGGTQVTIGGRILPLYFTSTGQIDAIVPYDLPQNSRQQIIVQSGSAYSQPEVVTVSAAQAGVFTQNQSGTGPGAILGQKPGGVPALNTTANPASAGDALLIFCTGLGTVSPSVPAGSAAPFALLNTDNPVTATVGGQGAQMLFAGLAPGYVGLYQVNLIVPSGITPGPSVPVVLTAAGADSVPVTVAIK